MSERRPHAGAFECSWWQRGIVVLLRGAGPMRHPTLILSFALASCSSRPAQPNRALQAGSAVIAFVGVTVVPCDNSRLIPDQTVVVRDAKIAEVGSSATVSIPPNATRVDGR